MFSLLFVMSASSCVRVESSREEYAKTRLTIAKDVNGVQLQWQSEKDLRYAILYQDPASRDPRWNPLPDFSEIRGTGDIMLVRLSGQEAMRREYRIQALVPVKQKR